MPDEVDERMVRSAFFSNVICTQQTKRLVATAEMSGESNGGVGTPMMKIFVPQSPEDDYDLVLSLCEDGTQRLTVDWDTTLPFGHDEPSKPLSGYATKTVGMGLHRSRITTVTPSTSNWHLWGDAEVLWSTVIQVLGMVGNPGYLEMNQYKGYCALRPPWKNKIDMTFHEAIGVRFNQAPDKNMFAGIDWSKVPDKETVPEGVGWDDLFGDDE